MAKTKKVPVYQFKKIGTVSVDVGTILIADPCRINSIAATQNPDDMVDSPLMPRGTSFDTKTGECTVEELGREIVDPATPAKPNPTKLQDFGTSEGTFVTLNTGLGDGHYDVYAEVVNYGGWIGERVAAIHMQFVADEDLVPYRGSKEKVTVELGPIEEVLEYNLRNKGTGKKKKTLVVKQEAAVARK